MCRTFRKWGLKMNGFEIFLYSIGVLLFFLEIVFSEKEKSDITIEVAFECFVSVFLVSLILSFLIAGVFGVAYSAMMNFKEKEAFRVMKKVFVFGPLIIFFFLNIKLYYDKIKYNVILRKD